MEQTFTESLRQVWNVENQVNVATRNVLLSMLDGKTGAVNLEIPTDEGKTYKLTIKSSRTRAPRQKKVTKKTRGSRK